MWKDLLDEGCFKNFKSKPDDGIKDDWWNDKWVPICWDGGGNNICLDLAPASNGGIHGQVITMWHDSEARSIEAERFREWLENIIFYLESGTYVYSSDFDGFVNADEL